jgi:hypothetical protein
MVEGFVAEELQLASPYFEEILRQVRDLHQRSSEVELCYDVSKPKPRDNKDLAWGLGQWDEVIVVELQGSGQSFSPSFKLLMEFFRN